MELRVRFVERPLSESKISELTAAVQSNSSLREATVSDVGLGMMASIVGKRLPKYIKDHIGRALSDTMAGNFEDSGETEGDVFVSVYGEILGPLFTCLERDGDFMVIRLMPSEGGKNRRKRADLLLVDRLSGLVMLQECKGHCSDYYSVVEAPDSFDICQRIRELRNKGKREQMVWPTPNQIGARRVRVSGPGNRIALPIPHAEQSVVVTVIPDGRTASPSFLPDSPGHDNCEESCKSCLFNGGPTVITVLSSERFPDGACLGTGGMNFLDWYKACERAIWGRAHGSFGQAYSSLLSAWNQVEKPAQTQRESIPLLIGLVEEAVKQKVFVDFRPIWMTFENVRLPEELTSMVRELHDVQGDMPLPRIQEGSARQLGRMLFGGEEQEKPSIEKAIGNWQFRVGMERGEPEAKATLAESNISEVTSGLLEIVMVPQNASHKDTPDDLQWGLSEILAGDRIPPDIIFDAFVEEEVEWTDIEKEETKHYHLGKSLRGPWFPFWPMMYNPRLLDEMRHCCPECDMLAHMIIDWQRNWRHWPSPFLFHQLFRHRHHRFPWNHMGGPWGFGVQPIAYVTSDARAVLWVPYWK